MKKLISILGLALILASGCANQRIAIPEAKKPAKKAPKQTYSNRYDLEAAKYRRRGEIPLNRSQYEGSLWKDESSWGNLFRDHRARFKGDVLTITEIPSILSVSLPPTATPAAANAQGGAQAEAPAAPVTPASTMTPAERERIQVQRAIQSISARVVKVLPNGNMVVIGEKIEYRNQNRVQYVTTVKGIVRPEDVGGSNEVSALKLARAEVQTKRRIQARSVKKAVSKAPSTGVLDRISHLTSNTGSSSSAAQPATQTAAAPANNANQTQPAAAN